MADVNWTRPRMLAAPVRRDGASVGAKRRVRGAQALRRTMSREGRHARTLNFRTDPRRRAPACIDRSLFCERISARTLAS